MNFPFIFVVFGCISINKSQMIDSELNITLSIIKHLNVKNCIFVTNLKDLKLFHKIKYLTFEENIYTTYKTSDQLKQYVMTPQYQFFKRGLTDEALHPKKTVIIWKNNIEDITKAFSNIDYFGRVKQFDWIIILNEQNILNIDFSKIRYGHYESNFLIVYSTGGSYQISEVYSIRKYWKPFIKTFGTWNNQIGLNASDQYIFSRRLNLEGDYLLLNVYDFQLQVSNAQELEEETLQSTLHLVPPIKNVFEFWTEMSKIMNFSFVNISDQNAFLKRNINDATDSYLNLAAWNSKTSGVLTYNIVPLWKYNIFLHIKYEEDEPVGLQSLIRPFSSELWMFLCVWLIISSASVLITDYLAFKCFSGNRSKHFSFTDSIFSSFETLLNQGGDHLSSSSSKILFISMLAKVFVLLPSYTGAVVSFLTIVHPYFPFNDIDGFFKDGSYRVVSIRTNSFLRDFNLISDDPTLAKSYAKFMTNSTKVESLEDQIELTCTDKKFAFLSLNDEHLPLLKAAEHLRACKILQIPQVIFTTIVGMSTNFDSALTSVFKHNWLRFQNYGIANKMKKSLNLLAKNEDFGGNRFQKITFRNIIPILIIFSSATSLALILFLCEIAYFQLKNRCIKKKKNLFKPKKKASNQFLRRNTV